MSVKAPAIPVWMSEFGNLCYNRILDLLFPRRCALCDDVLPPGQKGVCPECSPRIQYIGEHYCMKCGKALPGKEMEFCAECQGRAHFFDKGRAVFSYRSMAGSIYRFKYSGRREYADFYAEELWGQLGENIRSWKPDALVPVPIHWKRRAIRGYNQAEVLAGRLSRISGIPIRTDLIVRRRNTRPQKILNVRERQNNLKKAFIMRQNDVKLNTIVVIDDIYTTGSTADAIAQVLRAGGVRKVYVVSLTIGDI